MIVTFLLDNHKIYFVDKRKWIKHKYLRFDNFELIIQTSQKLDYFIFKSAIMCLSHSCTTTRMRKSARCHWTVWIQLFPKSFHFSKVIQNWLRTLLQIVEQRGMMNKEASDEEEKKNLQQNARTTREVIREESMEKCAVFSKKRRRWRKGS